MIGKEIELNGSPKSHVRPPRSGLSFQFCREFSRVVPADTELESWNAPYLLLVYICNSSHSYINWTITPPPSQPDNLVRSDTITSPSIPCRRHLENSVSPSSAPESLPWKVSNRHGRLVTCSASCPKLQQIDICQSSTIAFILFSLSTRPGPSRSPCPCDQGLVRHSRLQGRLLAFLENRHVVLARQGRH